MVDYSTSAETLIASTVVSCCVFCFGSAALYFCGVGSCLDVFPETLFPALRYVSAPVLTENWRPRQGVFSHFLYLSLVSCGNAETIATPILLLC